MIGGGIGGLCLAQGLKKEGIDVTVYERDRSRTDRLQGYRIHINPHGAQALEECLPPEAWEKFKASCGTGGNGFGFLDDQLRELLVLDPDPHHTHYSASRISLRQVLLHGLEEIEFDKRFERYEQNGDHITLHFTDGTTATCDVLVGADGANSAVRGQYLPHAERVDTGITAVAGKLFLDEDDDVRTWIPEKLAVRANSVIGPKDCGMFFAMHDGLGVTEADGALFDNTRPYLMWSYAAKDLEVHNGHDLREQIARRIRNWHPVYERIVRESHEEATSLWPIRTSVPVAPWAPSRVTLLGDAIHSMTPMRGIGANTALRDARHLYLALTRKDCDVVHAIGGYEERMREYGFAAVRDSLRSARQFAEGGAAARTMFKTVLRVVGAVPPVKRAMFRDHGVD
ncbi:monooxygenase [Lentzea sp. NBRC 105346]|nr:monooxygenase [Lentzea sp. NBRC 105346]